MGNGLLEQPLIYQVYYNGTMRNVTSPTTALAFTAPSLPDGLFVDNITVNVTAINRFSAGTPSDPENFEISKVDSYVCTYICTFVKLATYVLMYILLLDMRQLVNLTLTACITKVIMYINKDY